MAAPLAVASEPRPPQPEAAGPSSPVEAPSEEAEPSGWFEDSNVEEDELPSIPADGSVLGSLVLGGMVLLCAGVFLGVPAAVFDMSWRWVFGKSYFAAEEAPAERPVSAGPLTPASPSAKSPPEEPLPTEDVPPREDPLPTEGSPTDKATRAAPGSSDVGAASRPTRVDSTSVEEAEDPVEYDTYRPWESCRRKYRPPEEPGVFEFSDCANEPDTVVWRCAIRPNDDRPTLTIESCTRSSRTP